MVHPASPDKAPDVSELNELDVPLNEEVQDGIAMSLAAQDFRSDLLNFLYHIL